MQYKHCAPRLWNHGYYAIQTLCTQTVGPRILCNTNTVHPDCGTTDIMNTDTIYTFKRHLMRRTQHRFIVFAPYIYATCFGRFSGHHQACQYKNHLKVDKMK
jgi:hypothetical protein